MYNKLAVTTGKGSTGAARAAAGNGHARAERDAIAINDNGDHDFAVAGGQAWFTDVFILDAPGLTGTPGSATMGFHVDGLTSSAMEGEKF